MKGNKKSDLAILLDYAGNYKGLTFLGLGLSGVAMVLGMLPYLCNPDNPEIYLEITHSSDDAETTTASITETLSAQ